MNNSYTTQLTANAIRRDVRVPVGNVIVSDKWSSTALLTALKRVGRPIVSDDLGLVDFYPSSNCAILYATEADLVNEPILKRKITKLRKNNCKKCYVFAECTPASTAYYDRIQRFSVLELGVPVLPVSGQADAAQLLAHMETVETMQQQNAFLLKWREPPPSAALAAALKAIPGIGDMKVKALTQEFKSLKSVTEATMSDLTRVIGAAAAARVYNFFRGGL